MCQFVANILTLYLTVSSIVSGTTTWRPRKRKTKAGTKKLCSPQWRHVLRKDWLFMRHPSDLVCHGLPFSDELKQGLIRGWSTMLRGKAYITFEGRRNGIGAINKIYVTPWQTLSWWPVHDEGQTDGLYAHCQEIRTVLPWICTRNCPQRRSDSRVVWTRGQGRHQTQFILWHLASSCLGVSFWYTTSISISWERSPQGWSVKRGVSQGSNPGEGTHSMKVTTYAPPFRSPFFRPLKNLYNFDPYIWAKMRKCRISTPFFGQNLAKCIGLVSTPLFGPL